MNKCATGIKGKKNFNYLIAGYDIEFMNTFFLKKVEFFRRNILIIFLNKLLKHWLNNIILGLLLTS